MARFLNIRLAVTKALAPEEAGPMRNSAMSMKPVTTLAAAVLASLLAVMPFDLAAAGGSHYTPSSGPNCKTGSNSGSTLIINKPVSIYKPVTINKTSTSITTSTSISP